VELGKDVIPRDFDARTRVHEYGGAAAGVRNGVFYINNMADDRVYQVTVGDDGMVSEPKAVTPGVFAMLIYEPHSVSDEAQRALTHDTLVSLFIRNTQISFLQPVKIMWMKVGIHGV
jgi:hypothetical protein